MSKGISLKQIVQENFLNWKYAIDNLGHPVEYTLKIEEADYRLDFTEGDLRELRRCNFIEELVLNSLKSIFGVEDVNQIEAGEFGREIPYGITPKIDVYLGVSNGDYLVMVSDNGPGIPPENQEKIWSPKFSTLGTRGNGLPLLREKLDRLENYQVRIELESVVEKGTTFKMYFSSRQPAP